MCVFSPQFFVQSSQFFKSDIVFFYKLILQYIFGYNNQKTLRSHLEFFFCDDPHYLLFLSWAGPTRWQLPLARFGPPIAAAGRKMLLLQICILAHLALNSIFPVLSSDVGGSRICSSFPVQCLKTSARTVLIHTFSPTSRADFKSLSGASRQIFCLRGGSRRGRSMKGSTMRALKTDQNKQEKEMGMRCVSAFCIVCLVYDLAADASISASDEAGTIAAKFLGTITTRRLSCSTITIQRSFCFCDVSGSA